MAEYSMFWQTGTTGDGAAAGYTEAQTMAFFEHLFLKDITAEGVLLGYGNNLGAIVVPGATPYITIKTGAATVKGLHYWNTANLNKSLTKPAIGDTGFRIVVRATGSITREVRLAAVQNTDGVAAIPALTQDVGFPASGMWEIPLYEGVIDTSGDIWTDAGKGTAGVTDDRAICRANMHASAVVQRQGGSIPNWNDPGIVNFLASANKLQVGTFEATAGGTPSQTETITFPEAFFSDPIVLVQGFAGSALLVFDVQDTSTTDFDVLIATISGGNITVNPIFFWVALGGVA